MRIVLIGTVDSTLVTLEALREAGRAPTAIFGLDPKLKDRHSDYAPMDEIANRYGIPFTGVRSINDPTVVAQIADLVPDWLIVVGWSQICREPLLAIPRQGSIGYHPSPLPELRGRAVLAWTILLERRMTAGTLFRLAPGVDSGEILVQRRFDLGARETLGTLFDKHMGALREMWRTLAPRLDDPTLCGTVQDERLASYCAKRTVADGRIDWTVGAEEVDLLVRAVTAPYPGAFSTFGNDKIIVWEGEPWRGPRHYGSPGQVLAVERTGMLISCRRGEAFLARRWTWADTMERRAPRVADRLN